MASALHGQDDDEFEPRADNCIWLRQLDRTEVIDDQNILFYQHGNRVYRNYLPRACPGLDREERFMYEARSNQLCSVDTITVLEDWGSTGLTRGFTCALGEFRTVTEEEIEELRRTAERKEEIEDARD
jgi:hypothetical protein